MIIQKTHPTGRFGLDMNRLLLALCALLFAAPAYSGLILRGDATISDGISSYDVYYQGHLFFGPSTDSLGYSSTGTGAHFYFDTFLGSADFNGTTSSLATMELLGSNTEFNFNAASPDSSFQIRFVTPSSNFTTTSFSAIPPLTTFSVSSSPAYNNFTYTRNGTNYTGIFNTLAVSSDMPEPTTWMMLILGFGLVGGAFRAQRPKFSAA